MIKTIYSLKELSDRGTIQVKVKDRNVSIHFLTDQFGDTNFERLQYYDIVSNTMRTTALKEDTRRVRRVRTTLTEPYTQLEDSYYFSYCYYAIIRIGKSQCKIVMG